METSPDGRYLRVRLCQTLVMCVRVSSHSLCHANVKRLMQRGKLKAKQRKRDAEKRDREIQ